MPFLLLINCILVSIMKLSQIVNYPLGLFGLKIARKERLKFINNTDLLEETEFVEIYQKIKDYTLVPFERCYSLYEAVRYIIRNNIEGHFVECGVWKGGSCMLIAHTLLKLGITDRKIVLYDTFAGMTEPGMKDGEEEKNEWRRGYVSPELNAMSYSPLEEVKANLSKTNYPKENIVFVKGRVEETIPDNFLGNISLLRLDTDWYESTLHELTHLYPLLSDKGIVIIDDYGSWQGSKKAVDEYFSKRPDKLIQRIDYAGRLIIK